MKTIFISVLFISVIISLYVDIYGGSSGMGSTMRKSVTKVNESITRMDM